MGSKIGNFTFFFLIPNYNLVFFIKLLLNRMARKMLVILIHLLLINSQKLVNQEIFPFQEHFNKNLKDFHLINHLFLKIFKGLFESSILF